MKYFVRILMLSLAFGSAFPMSSATAQTAAKTQGLLGEEKLRAKMQMDSLIQSWGEDVQEVLKAGKTEADRRAVAMNIQQVASQLTADQQIILINEMLQLTERVAYSLHVGAIGNKSTTILMLGIVYYALGGLRARTPSKYAGPLTGFAAGLVGVYFVTTGRAEDLYANAIEMRSELLSVRLALVRAAAAQDLR